VLPEVALEADGTDARIAGVQALEYGERPVGRPVVHEDQLEGPRPRIERCERSAAELLDRS
jgi:hypothetical protein